MAFYGGMRLGRFQAVNIDITKHLEYSQKLLDDAIAKSVEADKYAQHMEEMADYWYGQYQQLIEDEDEVQS